MHPNPAFRKADRSRNVAFARERSFGVLVLAGPDGPPLLSHVPFLLDATGERLGLHLTRSNPILRALDAGPRVATLAVSGPDSYISPDWYGVPDQVPTWNYVAVHLTGMLEIRPAEELRTLIDAQTAAFETRLAPKPPWTSDKMTAEVMSRMMRQIVPCRMDLTEINGTWKLNQNKPDDVRLRAAHQVAQSGVGHDLSEMSTLMQDPERF